ncbi:hypothetical protein IID24_00880 [Patescibacteria group bacterium]|nr:hypothetical protein [Patescibacteria group bacterium]
MQTFPSKDNSPADQSPKSRTRYFLIAAVVVILFVGSVAAILFISRLQQSKSQDQEKMQQEIQEPSLSNAAREYLNTSWPTFLWIKDRIEETKKEAFIDTGTQISSIQRALDDTERDIDEITSLLSDVVIARNELLRLDSAEETASINITLDSYLDLAEQTFLQLLVHQEFQKDMIDGVSIELDQELIQYTEQYYRGGDRVKFILQTQSIADLSKDALSKFAIIKVPEEERAYYKTQNEYLQDIHDTFENLNESYRRSQFELVEPIVSEFMDRNNERNRRIKGYSTNFSKTSTVANDFSQLEKKQNELTNQYTAIRDMFNLPFAQPKALPTLTILFPNGGENLCFGDNFIIRWESKRLRFVKLYIREPGESTHYIDTFPADLNETGKLGTGAFPWNVGEVSDGTLEQGDVYELVIVGSGQESVITDASDGVFSILLCKG